MWHDINQSLNCKEFCIKSLVDTILAIDQPKHTRGNVDYPYNPCPIFVACSAFL